MANDKRKKKSARPVFLEDLSQAYGIRQRNISILTGDVHGEFWSPRGKNFLALEQLLNAELGNKFHLIRMDIASGLDFYDKATETEVTRICESIDGHYTPAGRIEALQKLIVSSKHSPLECS